MPVSSFDVSTSTKTRLSVLEEPKQQLEAKLDPETGRGVRHALQLKYGGEDTSNQGGGMMTPVYDPNRWKMGVTEVAPRPKAVQPPAKPKRKKLLKAAWGKHFPQLTLSDKKCQQLARIPYKPELIDIALSKTAASTAFGDNKQYDATGVINYTAAIARCLAGNSQLPKDHEQTAPHFPTRKNRRTPVSSSTQMTWYHVPSSAMETYHKLAATGTQSYTGNIGENMRALVDKKLVTILGKQGRTYNIRLRSLEERLTTYARHYVKACKVCNPPAKKLPHNRPQARKLARKHMGRKNAARNRALRADASTKGEL
jgi:hypothetical protein